MNLSQINVLLNNNNIGLSIFIKSTSIFNVVINTNNKKKLIITHNNV